MRIRTYVGIGLTVMIAAAAGCDGGTEPVKYGPIDSRITQGEKQSYAAGGQTPSPVIDLVFRNPLTGSVIKEPSPLERFFLPKLAYALQAVNVKVQPNSVVCVGEEQNVLVPAVRCVNSDNQGNTRFDFTSTTKAGTHRALIRATYGLETTIPDTVEIVVEPGPFAKSPLNNGTSWPGRTTPAEFPPEVAQDQYGNAVPYRLVVLTDLYAQLQLPPNGQYDVRPAGKIYAKTVSDVLGSAAARTIVVDSIVGPTEIDGANVSRVRAVVQVITAQGVSATGVFVTTRDPNPDGKRSVGLHGPTAGCAISSNACAY